MLDQLYTFFKEKPNASHKQILAVLNLLESGATIPFIARYRKEKTGGLDEVTITSIQDAAKTLKEFLHRREFILVSLEEQGYLTQDLKAKIENCNDLNTLEDIYLPYKKRKKTKADRAREWRLEGLAKIIMAQTQSDIEHSARSFLNENVISTQDAISGAQLIIADWINQDVYLREKLRNLFIHRSVITAKVKRGKKDEGIKFKDYFGHNESIKKCPSYRLLAILRGENEGFLNVHILPEKTDAMPRVIGHRIKKLGNVAALIEEAAEDAYDRLLAPSLENQARQFYKEKADTQAIEVFAKNLEQLLMSPPLGEKPILSIDPGFRTGCKVVCLDSSGHLLDSTTIFPHPPQNRMEESLKTLQHLCDKYQLEAIAIGDATAGRETWEWLKSNSDSLPELHLVNESGASIYSASDIARTEFPDEDITVRGSISIGRRLMDPLAELIKIDPKSIGVGEYQHDVNQSLLNKKLNEVVVSCVNKVGVNLNTASPSILTFVAGLGPTLAQNIIDYRNKKGAFTNINQLKKVTRLGDKAFEQCSGFLRIRNGKEALDNTGVHPESYVLVKAIAKDVGHKSEDLFGNVDLLNKIKLQDFTSSTVGLPTLKDILNELKKPGLDIRGKAKVVNFNDSIRNFNDVNEGMILSGVIKNITGFGAFVDIGIKESGLVHISQIANKFINHPSEAVVLNQSIIVKVLSIDEKRRRIQLTMKEVH